jgi:hypothetical protein
MLALLAFRTPAHAQNNGTTVLWVDCGGEDERPCAQTDPDLGWGLLPANTPSDNPGGNFSDRLRCDAGLKIHQESNNTLRCTNYTRLLVGEDDLIWNSAWLSFARQNQYGSIQADVPIVYAPILGTHNSYSNYQDGGDSAFSVDQGLSITNQLQLGARTIRLDPWLFSNYTYDGVTYHEDDQIRLCHSSSGFSIPALQICNSVDWQGNKLSRNRSFVFAIKEIAHWLQQHPSEFIILRLHDNAQGWGGTTINGLVTVDDTQGPYSVTRYGSSYFYDAIENGLGGMVYTNPSGVTYASILLANPDDYRYPSLRELRASGKQVLILSEFQSQWTFQDQYGSTETPDNTTYGVTGTGLSEIAATPTVLSTVNCNARSISQHPTTFANIGEDRSISQLLVNDFKTSALTSALLDTPKVPEALACGYNWLETDFLDTLPQAPNLSGIVNFFSLFTVSNLPTALNYTCDDYSSSTCSSVDHRREAMIWSWHGGDGTPGQPAQMTRAFGTPFGSWVSQDASSTAPYLCSAPQTINGASDATYDDDRQWSVTTTTGPWPNGEAVCQAEMGPGWHFWHPASAIQNIRAWSTLEASQNGSVGAVWINHFYGGIQALPQQISLSMPLGGTSNDQKFIVVSGGYGGKLTVTSDDPNIQVSSVPLYSHRDSTQTDDNDSNVFAVSLSPAATALDPGGYNFTVRVHEDFTQATLALSGVTDTALNSDAEVVVNVNVVPNTAVSVRSVPSGRSIMVDGVSYSTPQTFSWAPGSVHQVSAPIFEAVSAGEQGQFASWSDGLGIVHHVTTPSANNFTLTATFNLSYLLSLNPASGGTIQTNPSVTNSYYPAGSQVKITAAPNAGYSFTGFTGDLTGTTNPQTLTMNVPHTVGANFQQLATVQVAANAYNLPVIVDGTSYPTPATFYWAPNSSHTLSFTPVSLGTGKQAGFEKWSDGNTHNPRTITAVSGVTTYTPIVGVQWQVTTSVNPAGTGLITGAGWVNDGGLVEFTETTNGGYAFTGYTGGVKSPAPYKTVTVTAPLNVVANFTPAQPQINVTAAVVSDSDPSTVKVTLLLKNVGAGAAAGVITTVTAGTAAGNGTVSLGTTIPVVPTIQGGSSTTIPLSFNWPTTVSSINLTVNFTANGGAYQGSESLTLSR